MSLLYDWEWDLGVAWVVGEVVESGVWGRAWTWEQGGRTGLRSGSHAYLCSSCKKLLGLIGCSLTYYLS